MTSAHGTWRGRKLWLTRRSGDMKSQILAFSSSRRSHQPMRSSKAMPKWQMLLPQRQDHVRLRQLQRAWSQRSRSVRGTQTVLVECAVLASTLTTALAMLFARDSTVANAPTAPRAYGALSSGTRSINVIAVLGHAGAQVPAYGVADS